MTISVMEVDVTGQSVDLSSLADWKYYGRSVVGDRDYKAPGPSIFPDTLVQAWSTSERYDPAGGAPVSWTGGTPTATGTDEKGCVGKGGSGNNFNHLTFDIPAETTTRNVSVYVFFRGIYDGTLTLTLSDDLSNPVTLPINVPQNTEATLRYDVDFSADSGGQTLQVRIDPGNYVGGTNSYYGLQVITLSAGPTVTDINGDNVITEGATTSANGTNLQGITSVVMNGLTQPGFDNPGTGANVSWTADGQGAPSVAFGPVDCTFIDPNYPDPVQAATFLPKNNRATGTVAGYPTGPGVRSIWDDPAFAGIANGDQYDYDTTDDGGRAVTVAPDGVPTIEGLGSDESLFFARARIATNGNVRTADVPVFTNREPVITSVGGVTAGEGQLPSDSQNVEVLGTKFGDSIGRVLMMEAPSDGSEPVLDGSEVEQAVAIWTDTRIVLANLTYGELTASPEKSFIVESI